VLLVLSGRFRRLLLGAVTLVILLHFTPGGAAQTIDRAPIINLMHEALKSWHVPGAALAIVKDDQILLLQGFGVRELGQPGRVTLDTVFPIASCTKTFTTLALAMLVDEGKLRWDDPVRKHVDFFHLADPLADANVTLRDLVTHRTGVGRHELLWYRAPWGLEERIHKIGRVKPSTSFRSTFEYQSILFGTAGYAAGKASGKSWRDLIQQRILEPLQMKASFTTSAALNSREHASPHRHDRQGEVRVIPWYPITEPDPAGSINASAAELIKFLRLQLGNGVWRGKQLVSAASLKETHSPQMVVRFDDYVRLMNPDTLQLSYGMGWIIQDYRGQLLLMHGGAIDGFRAHFTLVPGARLGFVLLNNLDGTQMNLAVSNTLVDRLLGLPYKDWNTYYKDIQEGEKKQNEDRVKKMRRAQHQGTKPSRSLAAYTGSYYEPAYGQARVTLDKDVLILHWGVLKCPLEHFHYDTFLVNDDLVHLIDAPVVFSLGADGEVAAMQAFGQDFRRQKSR
jgi:CubicO group peptidase (beta-lactamase class C family)